MNEVNMESNISRELLNERAILVAMESFHLKGWNASRRKVLLALNAPPTGAEKNAFQR